jgi:hypothetical protein
MGVLIDFQLRNCTALDAVPKGMKIRRFNGDSVSGKIEGKNPVQTFWRLYHLLRPTGGGEYGLYRRKGNKIRPTGLRRDFGTQDDIPKQFREAALA